MIGKPPSDKDAGVNTTTSRSKFKEIFRTKAMYLLALFLFTYVGIATTISGWVVAFLQIERNGTANSGYVTAGFYGGA